MPGEELGNDLRGLHGRREADALGGRKGGNRGVRGEGQVRTAFGAGQGVDLVDDHRIHPGEPARVPEVSMRNNDSGVVMRMSGGGELPPSLAGVSRCGCPPDLAHRYPEAPASCSIPTSGERRLRSTSAASAFSGEMYTTRHRCWGSAASGPVARWSIAERNAASVLPDPVGATTSVWAEPRIDSHAWACAVVGAANARVNHCAVGSLNGNCGSVVSTPHIVHHNAIRGVAAKV